MAKFWGRGEGMGARMRIFVDMLTIHKASAGSGKTFQLTRRYLLHLLGKKDMSSGRYRLRGLPVPGHRKPMAHSEILAVTFTNKATQEMTERIVGELARMADTRPDADRGAHFDYFLKEFATDADTLAVHAGAALEDLLFNFSWFNVSTIDAFFQRVLNTFTRELELSPTRTVEIDDSFAISMAVGRMLQSINMPESSEASPADKSHRRHLESWLLEYMKTMAEGGSQANLFSQSSRLQRDLCRQIASYYNEKYKLHRAEIDAYFSDPARLERFAAAISESGFYANFGAPLVARSKNLVRHLGCIGSKTLKSRLEKWVLGDFVLGPKLLSVPKWADNPATAFNRGQNPSDALLDELATLCADVIAYNTDMQFAQLLRSQIFQLGLFGQVNRYLESFRRDNDSMLLSDTGDLLGSIISEQEAPFIYERMGSAIHHFLIDEFQDTSQLQWKNLQPLVLQSLSEGYDNLIIGDEKQCIYRFRNSSPELLGSGVETAVEGRFPGNVDIRGVAVSENSNWRSSPLVVRFNNTLFSSLAQLFDPDGTRGIRDTYRGLVQQVDGSHADIPGYVCVHMLPDDTVNSADGAEGEEAAADDTPESSDDSQKNAMGISPRMAEYELDRLTREISRQLDAGFKPSDIAVLVRKGHQGKAVIRHLMSVMEDPGSGWHHGHVPIVSADSIPVEMSPAVRMIICMLELTGQPDKIISPKNRNGVEEDVLEKNPVYQRNRLAHRFEIERFTEIDDVDADGRPVRRRLTDSEALAKAVKATMCEPGDPDYDERQAAIDAGLARLNAMTSPTLLHLTESIIHDFIPAETRRSDIAFITALQDVVAEFSENGNNSVRDFMDYWNLRRRSTNVEAPSDLQGINVMTIHKSKGLDFKCVHVPFFHDAIVGSDSMFRQNRGWYRIGPSAVPWAPAPDVPPFMLLPNRVGNVRFPAIAAQMQAWIGEQMVDALNVAYVAFTRAVNELIIYVDKYDTPSGKSDDKPQAEKPVESSGCGTCLKRAIDGATAAMIATLDPSKQPWTLALDGHTAVNSDGEAMFTLGEPVVNVADDGSKPDDVETPGEDSRPSPAELEDTLTFNEDYCVNHAPRVVSEMELEPIAHFDFNDERDYGTFLHSVLSRIRHIDDLDLALDSRARRYHLTAGQTEECRTLLRGALADVRVRPWFEGFRRVIMERPITTADAGVRRPDRVVWLADGTIAVVDYKFGEGMHSGYRRQLRDYCALLAECGYPGAKGYLWFPREGKIVSVD